MPETENDFPVDDDLELALAAFGDDLLDILNEDDDLDPAEEAGQSEPPAGIESPAPTFSPESLSPQTDPAAIENAVELVLDRYGDKLCGESKLAFAGSIAMACHTAADCSQKVHQRFVVFAIGHQRFAIPLSCVIEVANADESKITQLPHTAHWLRGVTCLRGKMLSVTDPPLSSKSPQIQTPTRKWLSFAAANTKNRRPCGLIESMAFASSTRNRCQIAKTPIHLQTFLSEPLYRTSISCCLSIRINFSVVRKWQLTPISPC